jgi:hypothetical protein
MGRSPDLSKKVMVQQQTTNAIASLNPTSMFSIFNVSLSDAADASMFALFSKSYSLLWHQ